VPLLSNTSSTSCQEDVADIKPVNVAEKLKPRDDFQIDIRQTKTPCSTETQHSVNPDDDNLHEIKNKNSDLYEVVGDVSETTLNQIHTKPEDSITLMHKNVKDVFYLESLMLPSALKIPEVFNPSDYKNKEKQKKVNHLVSERNTHTCKFYEVHITFLLVSISIIS